MSSGSVTQLQPGYNTNAKMKAMFVYNFTKYIEWPAAYKSGNFVIGVLGDTPLKPELDKMAKSKKAINQTIEVKKFSSISEISNCHMLYLASDQTTQLDACLGKLGNFSTLVIGEEKGMAQRGAGINFVVKDNKQKFELSKKNIEQKNLKVSSNLLALAIVVN